MPAVNPGTTGLVSWWRLDETSGTRYDAHGANHLTDVNTVTSAAGKVGTAAEFVTANSESLNVADNAALSMGDVDMTVAFWARPAAGVTQGPLVSKWDLTTQREYVAWAFSSTFRWLVSSNGTANAVSIQTAVFTAETWHFVVCRHDSVGNVASISMDAGTPVTGAMAGGIFDGTSAFHLGRSPALFGAPTWDGRLDEVALYKSAAGGGGHLSQDNIDWLYNAGSGRTYADLTAGGLLLRRRRFAALED